MIHCYICYTENVEPEWVCDTCGLHYCEDCSYTFGLHYQFQGSRCYYCAEQYRRADLTKDMIRENKIKLYVGNSSK